MIQRIQTLWLFLVFLMAALMLFFPIAEFQGETQKFTLSVFSVDGSEGIVGIPNPYIIGILTALLGVLSLGNIFQYKNRKLQIKINMVAMLVNMALLIAIFLISDNITANENVANKCSYLMGSWFPVAGILFLILANRSIRKDEALVKQSERLR